MTRIDASLFAGGKLVLRGTAWMPAVIVLLVVVATPVSARQQNNSRVAAVLGNFDIDGLNGPDRSADGDGDGLPDTWEVGGTDEQNSDVAFPDPSAIVPGSPPTSIFARRAVRTSATARDTDGDLLTDFIEVFGLKFIDDNGNGILDDACARDAHGKPILDEFGRPLRAQAADGTLIGEWFDLNGDGMPSIGEYPAVNILIPGRTDNADFDGFVFTDPTNPDTDGDGVLDSADVDPLINPNAFGLTGRSGDQVIDLDADNDGLGDLMDLGDDRGQTLDNPTDLRRVIELFRPDLFDIFGRAAVRIPEGLIEDMLAADWNGDGLFRLTDIRVPHFGIVAPPSRTVGDVELFSAAVGTSSSTNPLGFAQSVFPNTFSRSVYYNFDQRGAGRVNLPLPYQELLVPARRDENEFLSDPRIWTVLYSWRMPGFDIDGNGFIGVDAVSSGNRDIDVNGAAVASDSANAPSSDILVAGTATIVNLDGRIESDLLAGCGQGACGATGVTMLALTFAGVFLLRPRRR